jgi:predicted esterase
MQLSTRSRNSCAVLLALMLPMVTVSAQPPAAPAPAQALAGDTLRAALARGYLLIDRLVASRELSDAQRLVINRAFDRTTFQFFGGQFAAAVTSMDSIARALGAGPADVPPPPPTGAARQIDGQAPSVVRASLLSQLATVDSTGALQQAHAAATSRAGLLTDVASTSRSIELFIQPRVHAAAVAREVEALRAGRHPYAGRSGDWWREIVVGAGRRVPVRLIAPPSAVQPNGRAPLIVALHGAGGDENMFVDAYGAGVLTRLADSLGALVVSPLANGFTAVAFDSVLAVVRREYAVDSTRVYVVGHSMGAGITAALANARGAQLAAAAMLAGGSPVTSPEAPPVLFMAGTVDPVIPATRVKAAADATQAAGRSAVYREFPSEGHTLIVGRVLPEAIAWLFTHRR